MTRTAFDRPDHQPARALTSTARLTIQADACIPVRFPELSCRQCANACPTHALMATSRGPELASGCVDCGRCAIVCPTEALRVPGFDLNPTTRGLVAIDCWRVPSTESPRGAMRVPCLGGLSVAALTEWAAEAAGQAVVLLDRGFCGRCPAGACADPDEHPADRVIGTVQGLLEEMGVAPAHRPRLVAMPIPVARMLDGMGEPLLESRMSRRGLFTAQAFRPAAPEYPSRDIGTLSTPGLGRPRLLAALQRIAPTESPLPARLFPSLTATLDCADHRVCASVCPTGALTGYADDVARGLHFDAAACIGCELCVRLCPEQALRLEASSEGTAERSTSRLTQHAAQTCPQCGAEHSNPAEPVCPACGRDQDFARSAFQTLFSRPLPAPSDRASSERPAPGR
jgi:Fe-S-cluster-containing hydrogenase component 2